jgi:hypothetical protein
VEQLNITPDQIDLFKYRETPLKRMKIGKTINLELDPNLEADEERCWRRNNLQGVPKVLEAFVFAICS